MRFIFSLRGPKAVSMPQIVYLGQRYRDVCEDGVLGEGIALVCGSEAPAPGSRTGAQMESIKMPGMQRTGMARVK
jgi:hypothetical protein